MSASSLRGIFGDDIVNNAVCASCSLDSASRCETIVHQTIQFHSITNSSGQKGFFLSERKIKSNVMSGKNPGCGRIGCHLEVQTSPWTHETSIKENIPASTTNCIVPLDRFGVVVLRFQGAGLLVPRSLSSLHQKQPHGRRPGGSKVRRNDGLHEGQGRWACIEHDCCRYFPLVRPCLLLSSPDHRRINFLAPLDPGFLVSFREFCAALCWLEYHKVDPVISPLLQRVLKARPNDVASFAAQDLHRQGASIAS